jgi:hypothetical protein
LEGKACTNRRQHPRAAQTTILSLYVPDSPADSVPMPRHSAYTLTWLKKTLCTSKAPPTTRVTMAHGLPRQRKGCNRQPYQLRISTVPTKPLCHRQACPQHSRLGTLIHCLPTRAQPAKRPARKHPALLPQTLCNARRGVHDNSIHASRAV